jgi:hypothetical protein
MPVNKSDIITQAQLRIGAQLMENASLAARICKTYMQDFHKRIALGETLEPGKLTFNLQTMSVGHTVC